jgi:hypothetical protein
MMSVWRQRGRARVACFPFTSPATSPVQSTRSSYTMGRQKGKVWDYFHQGDSKFRTNNTFWEARCRACVKLRVDTIYDQERAAATAAGVTYARTEEDIQIHGAQWQISCASHLASCQTAVLKETGEEVGFKCGKGPDMLRHLRDCRHIMPDIRAWAAAELATKMAKDKANRSAKDPAPLTVPVTAAPSIVFPAIPHALGGQPSGSATPLSPSRRINSGESPRQRRRYEHGTENDERVHQYNQAALLSGSRITASVRQKHTPQTPCTLTS